VTPIFVLGPWTHSHTHLTALSPWLPRWASTRKVKPIWILLKQETVSDSGISWVICTLLQTDNHGSTPTLNFYRPYVLADAQPTASMHRRQDLELVWVEFNAPPDTIGHFGGSKTLNLASKSFRTLNLQQNFYVLKQTGCVSQKLTNRHIHTPATLLCVYLLNGR